MEVIHQIIETRGFDSFKSIIIFDDKENKQVICQMGKLKKVFEYLEWIEFYESKVISKKPTFFEIANTIFFIPFSFN